MKKIIIQSFLALICYYFILIFRFCHPFPKSEYFMVIWIQFAFGLIAYLFKDKYGRITVIICALLLVRLSSILGMTSPIITLMGVFFGGVVGNLLRTVRLYSKERTIENPKEDYFNLLVMNPSFILFLFLILLSLDRFLIYFGSPYLNGFGILETMFLPNLSSKEAFALSMETVTNVLFPLVYFYSEEISTDDKEEIRKDWKLGLLVGLLIQFAIIFIQVLWNRNFLADNTNLSLEANRVMGLFRDSGSSSWIIPVVCSLFYRDLLVKKRLAIILLILLLLIQIIIGNYQGRGFWLIFLFSFLTLCVQIWGKCEIRFNKKNTLGLITVICLLLIAFILIPKNSNTSFDRLLSIPEKLFSIFYRGKNAFLEIDPARYYLNLAGIKLFLAAPLFGNGIGSFIVNLKDSNLHLFTHSNEIDNPSLFLGLLSEIGILGIIIISLHFLSNFRYNRNLYVLILLFPVLSIGYHVVHPDGGFVLLLIFWIAFERANIQKNKWKKRIMYLCITAFICHLAIQIFSMEKIPEFRKKLTGENQLLAYEPNKSFNGIKYHSFKGKTIWVLAGANTIELDVFLDDSTSKIFLLQRWSILDKNRILLSDYIIKAQKNSLETYLINIPDNGYYLQVEELDEEKKSKFFGEVPFCIPSFHFIDQNKFL